MDHIAARFSNLEIGDPEPEQEDPQIASLSVRKGAVKVGGADGWYAGDDVHTTSLNSMEQRDGNFDNLPEQDGIRATSDETACQRARRLFGLDYEYEIVPAYDYEGGKFYPIKHQRNVRIKGTRKIVSTKTVSPRFHLLQLKELDLLDHVVGTDIQIDRGGRFRCGAEAWLQTRMGKIDTPSGPMETRAMARLGFDGTTPFEIALSQVVAACKNYYRSILKAGSICKIRHTASADHKIETLKRIFDEKNLAEKNRELSETIDRWYHRKVDFGTVIKLIDHMWPKDAETEERSKRAENQVEQFVSYYWEAPGANAGNLWGVAQAATYWANHAVGVRGKTESAKAENRWQSLWTGGAAQKFEEKALAYVHTLA